jgi:cell cycle arrest protein BUB2
MTLERLLREGPPNGDVEGALESTRLKILDQGIRSDGDGMVSGTPSSSCDFSGP